MSYETRAYDMKQDDGFGPDPCVVLVVTGTHDVSRLVHLFSRGLIEQNQVADQLKRQVNRHNGGRSALKLLAEHGGPDFLDREEADTAEQLAKALELLDRYSTLSMGGTPDLFWPECGHEVCCSEHNPWECMDSQVGSIRSADVPPFPA